MGHFLHLDCVNSCFDRGSPVPTFFFRVYEVSGVELSEGGTVVVDRIFDPDVGAVSKKGEEVYAGEAL